MSTNKKIFNPIVSVVELKKPTRSEFYSALTYKVVAINGNLIPSNRELFWNGKSFFYRLQPFKHAFQYHINSEGNQLVSLNRVTYVLNPKTEVRIDQEGSKSSVSPTTTPFMIVGNSDKLPDNITVSTSAKVSAEKSTATPFMVVGQNYRLANNIKVSVIAEAMAEMSTVKLQYIGVYLDSRGNDISTIRFDGNGKVLSHGNADKQFDIVDIWSEKHFWLVLYRGLGGQLESSKPFNNVNDAIAFSKTFPVLKIIKETI
jgi:hypothetical protein